MGGSGIQQEEETPPRQSYGVLKLAVKQTNGGRGGRFQQDDRGGRCRGKGQAPTNLRRHAIEQEVVA
eukprot:COSAG01_NODE_8242_length_2858_cov_29.822037_2_plen_67_part_00